jgi:hypothetical protein
LTLGKAVATGSVQDGALIFEGGERFTECCGSHAAEFTFDEPLGLLGDARRIAAHGSAFDPADGRLVACGAAGRIACSGRFCKGLDRAEVVEIGRHAILRGWWAKPVRVQVPPSAPPIEQLRVCAKITSQLESRSARPEVSKDGRGCSCFDTSA